MNMTVLKDILLISLSLFIFLICVLEMSKLLSVYHLEKKSICFFCKLPDSKYFSFSDHVVFVPTTQLCYYRVKAVRGNM